MSFSPENLHPQECRELRSISQDLADQNQPNFQDRPNLSEHWLWTPFKIQLLGGQPDPPRGRHRPQPGCQGPSSGRNSSHSSLPRSVTGNVKLRHFLFDHGPHHTGHPGLRHLCPDDNHGSTY
jgi:hypothetical protein